jgi:hypothetical protein
MTTSPAAESLAAERARRPKAVVSSPGQLAGPVAVAAAVATATADREKARADALAAPTGQGPDLPRGHSLPLALARVRALL